MGTDLPPGDLGDFEAAPSVLNWRITTRRALSHDVVPAFISVLRRRLREFSFDEEAVATVLQEALANAAIHGILGIAASARDGPGAADALWRKIEASLKDPSLAGRPLIVAAMPHGTRLLLTVRDCGAGFDPDRITEPGPGCPHGRGLHLMRALASNVHHRFDGRQVCLTFNLAPVAASAGAVADDDAGSDFVRVSCILVAGESEAQRDTIVQSLADAGFSDIAHATDGNEAIALYHHIQPDLVLLDLAMPGIDGIEVCRSLNKRHSGKVPVIVLGGNDGPALRMRAFEAGAVDYLTAPLHLPELVARVRTQLQNRWLLRSLYRFRTRLGDELKAAKRMQESLLPSLEDLDAVRQSMGIDIAAQCEMSSELGGDIWGLRMIDETRLGIYIADFTGHGVGSAMNAFRLHGVLGESGIRFERPDLVMQALNVQLSGILPLGSFATLFYGVLDIRTHLLHYTAAAAPPPLLFPPDGPATEIDTSGVPVGIKPWQTYPVKTVSCPPGASLFLYSDALIETRDVEGETWDSARMVSVLGQNIAASSEAQLAELLRRFKSGRPCPLPDDLTLIFLRRVI
jgi:sigma-B regulation protein RsbU (phosphoserine phosphatase)